MLNFLRSSKLPEQIPPQEVSIADAIEKTCNIPKVGRAVEAYVELQRHIDMGVANSQDTLEVNRRITNIYSALSDSGIKLKEESTPYGVDNTLHLFVTGYIATQKRD